MTKMAHTFSFLPAKLYINTQSTQNTQNSQNPHVTQFPDALDCDCLFAVANFNSTLADKTSLSTFWLSDISTNRIKMFAIGHSRGDNIEK